MAVPEMIHRFSEAEYLAIERAADFKSEFFDGEMFAMSGGTPMHSLIATNLASEVRSKLKGGPCVPFNSDLRLKIIATGLCTYPDLSVVCGPLEFAGAEDDVIVNPTLLAEVLSDSTEAYDRGKNSSTIGRFPRSRNTCWSIKRSPASNHFSATRAASGVCGKPPGWRRGSNCRP